MKNVLLTFDDDEGAAITKVKRESNSKSWEEFVLGLAGIRRAAKERIKESVDSYKSKLSSTKKGDN